jgi:hypothetical protein
VVRNVIKGGMEEGKKEEGRDRGDRGIEMIFQHEHMTNMC